MKHLVMAALLVAWTYTQDNGTQAWTDDPERVPAKYEAEKVELGDWKDYPRLSIVEPIVVDSEELED